MNFLQQTLNGLSFSGLLFLLGSGFALTFGLLRIVNIAHGAAFLIGGYVGYSTIGATGSFWLGLLAGTASMGAAGLVLERGLLSWIVDQEMEQFLLTIGVAFIAADFGLVTLGRRMPRQETVELQLDGERFALPVGVWLEALDPGASEVLATSDEGDAVALRIENGQGEVIVIGTFAGFAYGRLRSEGLEQFMRHVFSSRGAAPRRDTKPLAKAILARFGTFAEALNAPEELLAEVPGIGEAAEFVIWGSGTPRREFLHVDDMAAACIHLMEHYDGPSQVNVGSGSDVTIKELAGMIADATGFAGSVEWDTSKPDGMAQKLLDVTLLTESGWTPQIELASGIAATVQWYRANAETLRL